MLVYKRCSGGEPLRENTDHTATLPLYNPKIYAVRLLRFPFSLPYLIPLNPINPNVLASRPERCASLQYR